MSARKRVGVLISGRGSNMMVRREHDGEPDIANWSFRKWAESTFGKGIARHFMLPYNRKLWCTDLDEIECGWVSWSIPRPKLDDVLAGALGQTVRGLGYNPTFLYPERGGISVLPKALAARCSDVRLRSEIVAVDTQARLVRLADGSTIGYEALISTLPLDRLLAIASPLPDSLPSAGKKLRAVKVINISLGVDRPGVSGAHWIYFPEKEYSFYRAGFPGNLSPHVAPRGCSSLYVERSLRREESFDDEEVVSTAIDDLRRVGILWKGDRIVYRRVSVLDPAYVIYDRFRARNVPEVLEQLGSIGIHSAGRFGAWEYSSMEGAMRDGRELAARLRESLGGRFPIAQLVRATGS